MLGQWKLKIYQTLFRTQEQQAFLEDIAALVEDGVSLKQALEVYLKLSHDSTKILAEHMLTQISAGKPVADGMQGWFPDAIVEIIRAGEEGGILAKTLRSAAASLGKRQGALLAIFNMMAYPAVVITMALGVAIFINHTIFSSFRAITPMERWPDNAKTLSSIASFVQDWWWLIIITLITFFFLFTRFLSDYIGDWRVYIDKFPIVSLYRKMNAARLMETLGLLMTNGLILKRALKILQAKSQPYLASHLILMEHRLGAGQDNIADVLDTGLISEGDLTRLRLIAQSKGFEEALVRQGQRSADEGERAIRVTGRIFAGGLLGGVAMFAIYMIFAVYGVGFSVVPS